MYNTPEFNKGYADYSQGVSGYAATPYADNSQAMTDWFVGWLSAQDNDGKNWVMDWCIKELQKFN